MASTDRRPRPGSGPPRPRPGRIPLPVAWTAARATSSRRSPRAGLRSHSGGPRRRRRPTFLGGVTRRERAGSLADAPTNAVEPRTRPGGRRRWAPLARRSIIGLDHDPRPPTTKACHTWSGPVGVIVTNGRCGSMSRMVAREQRVAKILSGSEIAVGLGKGRRTRIASGSEMKILPGEAPWTIHSLQPPGSTPVSDHSSVSRVRRLPRVEPLPSSPTRAPASALRTLTTFRPAARAAIRARRPRHRGGRGRTGSGVARPDGWPSLPRT